MNVLPVLLKHESAAVRQAAISFLMAAASRLSSTDLHVFLKPRLESTFPKEPASLTKAVDILKVLPSESDEGVTKKVLSQKRCYPWLVMYDTGISSVSFGPAQAMPPERQCQAVDPAGSGDHFLSLLEPILVTLS